MTKVELSFVDETLWQAAERTVTPMWEIATTSSSDDGVAQKKSSVALKAPNANDFLHHDKVSGGYKYFIAATYEQKVDKIFPSNLSLGFMV